MATPASAGTVQERPQSIDHELDVFVTHAVIAGQYDTSLHDAVGMRETVEGHPERLPGHHGLTGGITGPHCSSVDSLTVQVLLQFRPLESGPGANGEREAQPGRFKFISLSWRRHTVGVFCEKFRVQR
jgi:hypothetical protein